MAPYLLNHARARRGKGMVALRDHTLGGCKRWLTARTISTRVARVARQAVLVATRCPAAAEVAPRERARARAVRVAASGSSPAAAAGPRVVPIVVIRTTKGSAARRRVAVRATAT